MSGESPGQEAWPAENRAALAEAELRAAEAEVQALREREQKLVALLVETRGERDAANHWLEQHRLALSWRLTEPLRAAKGLVARGRHR